MQQEDTVRTALAGRDTLLADAAARARRYLEELGDRRVGPSFEAVRALGALDFPLPDRGLPAREVLGRLDDIGSPATTVVIGAEAHTTVPKALGLLGLGRERVLRLPVDDQGRVVAEALPSIEPPAIVCLQAANVNSGAFDPFPALINWAHSRGAWVHIDGAFGLWALTNPNFEALTEGITAADSWATDAHKWLNTTYDCGIAFTRDGRALFDAMAAHAAYYVEGAERQPALFTPQSSQRARGVEVWAVLAALGREGVAEIVSRTCALARRFAVAMKSAGFQVLNDVVLNQVVVSFGVDGPTDDVLAAIQNDGTCWCGPTTWRDRRAMRVSVSGWATTADDIDRSADAVIRVARDVLGRTSPSLTD